MSLVDRFASQYNAIEYAYGIANGSPALQIGVGNSATGVGAITLITGTTSLPDGTIFNPIAVGTPITVGIGANAETVTPTGVTAGNIGQPGPGPNSVTITATFNNLHGPQEPVTSGTYGLQEAINAANGNGGGAIQISAGWYNKGGTTAIIQAASLPSSGSVDIDDPIAGVTWSLAPSSLSLVAAPATATSAVVASQAAIVGTWTATTIHVVFSYVTADGGESLTSSDYSFTATASVAIGGSGPIASTGAVGYRVYIGTTAWLAPVTAANGTVIQCGPIAAFKIGSPFSIATATTSALAIVPVQSTAFTGVQPMPFGADYMAQPFQTVSGPFAVTGSVTTGSEWGKIQLPAGFLNTINRTIRLKFFGYWTPAGTANLIITITLASVYNTTQTTVFTVTTANSSGTTAANINGEVFLVTAATGATGTIEAHGTVIYGGATASAGILIATGDSVQAPSSAVDLTKQDAIIITISSGATVTQSQLRKLIAEVIV